MPQASTWTRIWFGAGSGNSRSTSSKAPPAFDTCTARIIFAMVAPALDGCLVQMHRAPWRCCSLRDVEETDAHLVVGAFAPVEIPRSTALGLVRRAVVPVALDGEAVVHLHARRGLQRVRALPVEVPAGNVEEALVAPSGALDLEAVVRAAKVLVRGGAVDGERAGGNGTARDEAEIGTRREGERVTDVRLAGGNVHRVRAQPGWVRPGENEGLPLHGIVELQLERSLVRSSVPRPVVVDLQDDLRAGIDGHPGARRKVAAAAPRDPAAERRHDTARAAEAGVSGRRGRIVERLELRDLAGRSEKDQRVVDDGSVSRLRDDAGDVG